MEFARLKAYTARTVGRTSLEVEKGMEKPENAWLKQVPSVVGVGGGVPIKAGTETIGGVGVSLSEIRSGYNDGAIRRGRAAQECDPPPGQASLAVSLCPTRHVFWCRCNIAGTSEARAADACGYRKFRPLGVNVRIGR